MKISEVKKKIGKKNYAEFQKYMLGQTVGVYPDGTVNIYKCDVEKFLEDKKAGRKPTTMD